MDIRPMTPQDLDRLIDIDGTIQSRQYIHLDRTGGDGLAVAWRLEERSLRERLIDPNTIPDETRFLMKQLVLGAEEGIALAMEHEGNVVAVLAAVLDPARKTFRIIDVRV